MIKYQQKMLCVNGNNPNECDKFNLFYVNLYTHMYYNCSLSTFMLYKYNL